MSGSKFRPDLVWPRRVTKIDWKFHPDLLHAYGRIESFVGPQIPCALFLQIIRLDLLRGDFFAAKERRERKHSSSPRKYSARLWAWAPADGLSQPRFFVVFCGNSQTGRFRSLQYPEPRFRDKSPDPGTVAIISIRSACFVYPVVQKDRCLSQICDLSVAISWCSHSGARRAENKDGHLTVWRTSATFCPK
jgi:hypothetical protein